MAFWSKIYNLWRQPTRSHNLEQNKYLPYFDGYDNFPLKWHDAISKSPSATACVSTIQDFLEGAGFNPEELEKLIVNSKGETFWNIHQKTCRDFGEFEGFYWLLRYNALGKITEWEVLPFENCRLGKPDDNGYIGKIYYNPYFGTADFTMLKTKDTKCYYTYNPLALKSQIEETGKNKFPGQVYFYGSTNALSRFYPMPEAHSAENWFKIENGVSEFHSESMENSFLQEFMLGMIGNPNEPYINPEASSEETPKTVAQAFDELLETQFMGAKKRGNMWVNWFSNKEELPQVITFPSTASADKFISLDTQATKKITVAFKVPSILANINEGVSLGGDGNMIRVAVKLMQQRSIRKQRILTDAYETILKLLSTPYTQGISITPYNPYPELEILDDKIWAAMTKDEQRDWIEDNTDIVLTDDAQIPAQAPPPGQVQNSLPVGFPEKIRNSIKRALEYQDKMGLNCSRGGRQLSEAILNNQSMNLRHMKRIYNYLKKNENQKDKLFSEGCNAILYHAWGGKDMEDFLATKLKDIDQWLN